MQYLNGYPIRGFEARTEKIAGLEVDDDSISLAEGKIAVKEEFVVDIIDEERPEEDAGSGSGVSA